MSWSIAEMENTVKVSKKVAKELFESQEYEDQLWYEEDYVIDSEGHLQFNSDHMEHMDYLGNTEFVVEVLKKNKAKGRICFGSLEGDNSGSFWGYEFDGKGGMKELSGQVVWSAA